MDLKQSLVLSELYTSDFAYSDGKHTSHPVVSNGKVHLTLTGENSKGHDVRVRLVLDEGVIGHVAQALHAAVNAIEADHNRSLRYAKYHLVNG